jgi:hypothetical protein
MSSSPSPLTEEAFEAFLELALDPAWEEESLDAAVFLGSLPEAARFASRAALEAETMIKK